MIKQLKYTISRAETIHRGFDFVRFVLLGSEFDSFSVFSVRSVSIFSHTYKKLTSLEHIFNAQSGSIYALYSKRNSPRYVMIK